MRRALSTLAAWWLWANATDLSTWILHAAVTVVLGLATSPTIAFAFYAVREVEQVVNALANRRLLREQGLATGPVDWFDHVMDVATPALAAGALVLLGVE